MVSEIEVRTTREVATSLSIGGYSGPVVRVKCRRIGERRWRGFLLVPDEGQPLEELEENAALAAESYLAEARL